MKKIIDWIKSWFGTKIVLPNQATKDAIIIDSLTFRIEALEQQVLNCQSQLSNLLVAVTLFNGGEFTLPKDIIELAYADVQKFNVDIENLTDGNVHIKLTEINPTFLPDTAGDK